MQLPLSNGLKQFILTHEKEDTNQLILNAGRYPDIDVPFAVDQILARRHIKDKLPVWYQNADLVFPSRLSAEQCSSEITARHKQSLLYGHTVCDLTGGLGIDSWYFSQKARHVIYTERIAEYCEAARHNFKILGATNIEIRNGDALHLLPALHADTFYLDPARRSGSNKRLFALAECEPNVLDLKEVLLRQGERIILKISPMADLTETLRLLPETVAIHIVALKNECKEILFLLENQSRPVEIHTFDYTTPEKVQQFSFLPEEEKQARVSYTDIPGNYLYEPNAALLKSGAFKLIAQRYHLHKLNPNSHLYTSARLLPHFPGRCFQIDGLFGFSGKILKQLCRSLPQANITARNFPLKVEEIRKKSGITDGGSQYLFATTTGNARRILIQCTKI